MRVTNAQRRVRAALKGKTQNQLARDLHIAPAYLSMILAGKRRPSLTVALAIERATGVPACEFDTAAS